MPAWKPPRSAAEDSVLAVLRWFAERPTASKRGAVQAGLARMPPLAEEPPADGRQGTALIELGRLLHAAQQRLEGQQQPVVVAACPCKFDDRGDYPDWLGVQVGRAYWERAEYDSEYVREDGRDPDHVAAARQVLDALQAERWRDVAERALGFAFTQEVLAFVLQHDAAWFVVSASNIGRDMAFVLDAAGTLTDVGMVHRIDGRLGLARPVWPYRLDAAKWSALSAAVPSLAATLESMPDTAAAVAQRSALHGVLRHASATMRSVQGDFRCAVSQRYRGDGRASGIRCKGMTLDTFHVITMPGDGKRYFRDGGARLDGPGARQADAVAMDARVDMLEAADWRGLVHASVTAIEPGEALALLACGDACWLILGGEVVFSLAEDGTLAAAGICDDWVDTPSGRRPLFHLFDGRSLTVGAAP